MTRVRPTGWPVSILVDRRASSGGAQMWRLRMPGSIAACGHAWSPPTDVFETDDGGVVRVEVAGLNSGETALAFDNGRLLIAGDRRDPNSAEPRGRCALKEIASGRFRVEVEIPWRVEPSAIRATYADGFLTVLLPRLRA